MFDWCDFTFNNLLMTSGSNGMDSRNGERGSLSLRVEDPTKKFGSAQFLGICIRDIIGHRLVPMCPDEYLVLTEETTAEIRRHHVNMIATAIRMIDKGWTLCPSLTGKTLYSRYTRQEPVMMCALSVSIPLDLLGRRRRKSKTGGRKTGARAGAHEIRGCMASEGFVREEHMRLNEKSTCDSNDKGKEVVDPCGRTCQAKNYTSPDGDVDVTVSRRIQNRLRINGLSRWHAVMLSISIVLHV